MKSCCLLFLLSIPLVLQAQLEKASYLSLQLGGHARLASFDFTYLGWQSPQGIWGIQVGWGGEKGGMSFPAALLFIGGKMDHHFVASAGLTAEVYNPELPNQDWFLYYILGGAYRYQPPESKWFFQGGLYVQFETDPRPGKFYDPIRWILMPGVQLGMAI
ncbi:MAG: hypothetical protein AAF206_11375 [Bacteroidota bacterium]